MSRTVIKLSGKVTDSPAVLARVAQEIALGRKSGAEVIVVHGGGKQLDEMASKLGLRCETVAGRRITDAATLELAIQVFGGINARVSAALLGAGVEAVGVGGFAGRVITATKRSPKLIVDGTESRLVDFGFVGDVADVRTDLLQGLLAGGFVPVVSSLGADLSGQLLNINADTIAAEIAAAIGAEVAVFVGDTDGILRDPKDSTTLIQRLSISEARDLVQSGHASGGMLPKIAALAKFLEGSPSAAWPVQGGSESPAGVHAHLVNGLKQETILAAFRGDVGVGTIVTRRHVEASH